MAELTTLDKVKRYLQMDDTTHDAVLQDLITAASVAVETYTGRLFSRASFTERYDGTGFPHLVLNKAPVDSVELVKLDGQELPADDYAWYSVPGVLRRRRGCWPEGVQNIEVTYTAGYDWVPPDVEQAVILLVSAWFKTDISDFSNLLSEAGGVIRPEAMPSRVRALLDPYRRVFL